MSYSDEMMKRYKARMNPLVGAGPHNRGKSIHLGWEPRKTCPTIPYLVDEVRIWEQNPTTKYYSSSASQAVWAGVDIYDDIYKTECIFVTDSNGMSDFDSVIFPWAQSDALFGEPNPTGLYVDIGFFVVMLLNSDLITPGTDMYYQDATWDTHKYDWQGAAHGSVLYADADDYDDRSGNGYSMGPSWQMNIKVFPAARIFYADGYSGKSGLYFGSTITNTVYGFHVICTNSTWAKSDITYQPAPTGAYDSYMWRYFYSTKPTVDNYRQRGHSMPSAFAPGDD